MNILNSCHLQTMCVVTLVSLFCAAVHGADWYVATNGIGGGTTWADATNSFQGAITKSGVGDVVWVSNGVYDTGGLTGYPAGTILTNRIAITKAITVRSANNNPANTVIKGAWASNSNTNGPAAVRCVYMAASSRLYGFTLTNGATLTATESAIDGDRDGGGVFFPSSTTPVAIISNCVIAGNSASRYGGGAWNGTFYNCTIVNNSSVDHGGGARSGTMSNCTLRGNSSSTSGGGGVRVGAMTNCISLDNNKADDSVTPSYSCGVGAYYNSGSHFTNNPQFVNSGAGNNRLRKDSPCINTGTNQAWMTGAFDLDGRPRVRDGTVDRGCYEYVNPGTIFAIRGH